jgi:hypothetical protein
VNFSFRLAMDGCQSPFLRYVVQREDLTGKRAEDEAGAGLMRSRRYDLHITYDKYYQVSRQDASNDELFVSGPPILAGWLR